jgi:hypothetical protein
MAFPTKPERSDSSIDAVDPEKGSKIDLSMYSCYILHFLSFYSRLNFAILATATEVTGFDDPNLDKNEAAVGAMEDDSPYPEVRSAVANTDDPEMPVNTIRAWVLGMLWAIIISGMNQFFFFRYPSVTVTPVSIGSARKSD